MRVYDIETYLKEKFTISLRPSQIYYWEKQGILKVKRNTKNRRSFSEDDIKVVLLVWMLNEIRMSIKLVKQIVIDNDLRSKEIAAQKVLLLENTIIPALKNYLSK
jgi:DNA-binding transcriptional MerR regulator